MKKNYYFLALILALGSCTQDDIIDNATITENTGNCVLTAGIQEQEGSRLNISEQGKLSWSDKDEFVAFEGTTSSAFTLKSGANTANGTFVGNVQNPTFAVYPSSINPTVMDDGQVKISLPNSYEIDKSQNLPMYGTVDNGKVKFSNLTAVLRIQYTGIPDGFTKIKVRSVGAPIAGDFKFSSADLNLLSDETKSYSVTVASTDNTLPYYLPIPSGTYEELHISVLSESDEIQLLAFKNVKFEPRTINSIKKNYNTRVVAFDATNLVEGVKTDAVQTTDAEKDHWFTLAADDFGTAYADPAEGALKMEGVNGQLAKTSTYRGCTGGYYFKDPMANQGVYKLTFKVKSSIKNEKVGGINTGRLSITTIPSDLPKGGYGTAYKMVGLDNVKKDATKKIVLTADPNKAMEWIEYSVYIDFSLYATAYADPLQEVTPEVRQQFEIRFWPQSGQTIWIKDLQLSEVIVPAN